MAARSTAPSRFSGHKGNPRYGFNRGESVSPRPDLSARGYDACFCRVWESPASFAQIGPLAFTAIRVRNQAGIAVAAKSR